MEETDDTRSAERAHMTLEASPRPTGRGIRLAAKIALFLGFLVFLNYAMGWLANVVERRRCRS